MGRIWLALRVFFGVLFNGQLAGDIRETLAHRTLTGPTTDTNAANRGTEPGKVGQEQALSAKTSLAKAPRKPQRSESLTLLATLQREARFIDFIKEPIDAYSDAQIGAAVRDVHRDCGKVLERLFQLQPVLQQEEGSNVELPRGFDGGRYRLSGNVHGEPPFQGRLVHPGWQAALCQLPEWSGGESTVLVVAPAEVELP